MSKKYVGAILIFLTFTLNFGYVHDQDNSVANSLSKTRVILLGTRGGPRVGQGRHNPATLILIHDTPYVVDCGYGTSHQLVAAGVPLNRLRYIFITHHHSDHNLDYGPLLYNAWVTSTAGRIDAYGPPGLTKMTDDFLRYLQFDINTRMQDEGRSNPRSIVFPHEIDKPGVILSNKDVQVSAILVRHPPIKYAFAYRFNAKDRSIVISGDTDIRLSWRTLRVGQMFSSMKSCTCLASNLY